MLRSLCKSWNKIHKETARLFLKIQQRGIVENQLSSVRPPKLSKGDVKKLKRIVMSDRKLTLTQVTAAYNQQIEKTASVCTKT